VADFLDVGGVKTLVAAESWQEERIPVGDYAGGGDALSMSGRPIETRAAIVRRWTGQTPRDMMQKQGNAQNVTPQAWERMIRWLEGWGQSFIGTLGNPSGAGIALTPAAGISAGQVVSGSSCGFTTAYSMNVRRGFDPTSNNGWTFGFKRTFTAGEAQAAGSHWCVATGRVVYAQSSVTLNPAGVTQYVDGAAANFNAGAITNVTAFSSGTGAFNIFGFKTDGVTGQATTFTDIFFVPFQMPANWISQIWTNLINAGVTFPNLPKQKLSGQWLTNEVAPVEVIGRLLKIQQRVGTPDGQTWQNDLREMDVSFQEA
jgi:hypothetical protein